MKKFVFTIFVLIVLLIGSYFLKVGLIENHIENNQTEQSK